MIRPLMAFALAALLGLTALADDKPVKEQVLKGPGELTFKVRMEGPYTADVPLQVVCYFKYTADGAKKMQGAPVELDKKLGGVIAALRQRGEFAGDALETVLIDSPPDTIQAKKLLLVGLGDEKDVSLALMEKVGRTALRQAAALGSTKVAFAPLLRDQGNDKFGVGEVETAVVRGLLLAYDTDRRMQKEKLAKGWALTEWWVEAGPAYFDETVAGVEKGVTEAKDAAAKRPTAAYRAGGK
jgi:Cytosol aminopeptidase family, N-terminal domain